MGEYGKKIEGQCGTCAHALDFGSGPSPSGPEDGVHCDSLDLAKQLDEQQYSATQDISERNLNEAELTEYGFMDLFRLECLAEETVRCDFWKPK